MYKCHVQSNLSLRKTWSCWPTSSNIRLAFHPYSLSLPKSHCVWIKWGQNIYSSVLWHLWWSLSHRSSLAFPIQQLLLTRMLSSTFESGLAINGRQQFTRPHESEQLFRIILPSEKHGEHIGGEKQRGMQCLLNNSGVLWSMTIIGRQRPKGVVLCDGDWSRNTSVLNIVSSILSN